MLVHLFVTYAYTCMVYNRDISNTNGNKFSTHKNCFLTDHKFSLHYRKLSYNTVIGGKRCWYWRKIEERLIFGGTDLTDGVVHVLCNLHIPKVFLPRRKNEERFIFAGTDLTDGVVHVLCNLHILKVFLSRTLTM
jgi:hypothetical protein